MVSVGYSIDGPFSLSQTLEIANDDWNLSRLATGLGHQKDAAVFARAFPELSEYI